MISTKDSKYSKDLVCKEACNAWNKIKRKPKHKIENTIEHLIINAASTIQYLNPVQYFNTATSTQDRIIKKIIVPSEPSPNAIAQKIAKEIINKMNEEIAKYQEDYNSTTDPEAKHELIDRIQDLKQQVVKYDSPGHSPLLHKYLDLLEHIYKSIEFRAANSKRRKEVINIRTINYIKEELELKYNKYLSQTAINNYLLSYYSNSIEAKNHYYPTNIQVTTVSRNERADHPDVYYCFASVKAARQFAALFPTFLAIVSQDDKAKVLLSIPAIGKSFKAIQSNNKPVTVLNHDFPAGSQQKLIPSVYLIIDPSDTNNTLHRGQMSIYICPQYEIETSSKTHMNDLYSLMNNSSFNNMLKVDNKIRPIWVLLVDENPDENSHYLKNISHYCDIFCSFDLNYLIIRTHAPGYSAYNLVKRSIASLSTKLASIVLPVNKYGTYLDSQSKKWDKIFEKPVMAKYIDMINILILDIISWEWIEIHVRVCRYSLDVKKCNNIKCCFPKRCKEAANLLVSYNGFFSSLVMGKDGYYINSIHLLEYLDKEKILGPKKDETMAKEIFPIKCRPERPKNTETTAKKQKTK
ncbi:21802_t:CDS:2 [Cetraspora pellucida]|uniref:21802_t:CDS:1 n=1 Tax=Cetraspora pellucida TaxID=1433469 RepID=A0A9N8ZEB0_9GLOM|nr:21802_t:CDS:2 [Cetraspora pellucida]